MRHDSTHYVPSEESQGRLSPSLHLSKDRQILDPETLPPPIESYSPPGLLENQTGLQSDLSATTSVPHALQDITMVNSCHALPESHPVPNVSSIGNQEASSFAPIGSMGGAPDPLVEGNDRELSHGVFSDGPAVPLLEATPTLKESSASGNNIYDFHSASTPKVDSQDDGRNLQQRSFSRELGEATGKGNDLNDSLAAATTNELPVTSTAHQYSASQSNNGAPSVEISQPPPSLAPSSQLTHTLAPPPSMVAHDRESQQAPLIRQPPMAVSALKRCTYETYSSDDDDVFLPNPPSKGQADKCIVSMDSGDDSNPSSKLVAPPVLRLDGDPLPTQTAADVEPLADPRNEVEESMETEDGVQDKEQPVEGERSGADSIKDDSSAGEHGESHKDDTDAQGGEDSMEQEERGVRERERECVCVCVCVCAWVDLIFIEPMLRHQSIPHTILRQVRREWRDSMSYSKGYVMCSDVEYVLVVLIQKKPLNHHLFEDQPCGQLVYVICSLPHFWVTCSSLSLSFSPLNRSLD